MTRSMIPMSNQYGLLDNFQQEMNDLFSRLFNGDDGGTMPLSQWSPELNVSEAEDAYEVTVDLPGVKLDDIDVELKHGDLWICGSRKEEAEDKGKTWHRVERYFGNFRRVIRLGENVDAEHVEADFKDGVLHVMIPKTEETQTKRITVKS